MKSSLYLVAFTLLVLASSCSKKKDTPYDPSGALAAVVKSVTHSNTGATETYTYDGQGRIQLIQSTAGNKTTFEYADTTITQTRYDTTGAVVSITHYLLDTLGLVSSSAVTDAGATVVAYHSYTYDSDKHKTQDFGYTPSYDVNGKSEWQWGGGNMYEFSLYDSAVTHKAYDGFYIYYDPAVTSFGYANTGQKFFGTDSKYLIRKELGYIWGGGNVVHTYEYTFDAKQRITETKTFDYNGTLKNTDTYTYY